MKNALKVIEKADSFLAKGENRKIKDNFLENYSKCEVICRQAVKDYLKSIGEHTTDDDIGMELQNIKRSLSELGYSFDDSKLLTRIWGKSKKQGKSSCRFLRNKITHELMERALQEVVERKNELNADMEKFIEVITTS